MSRSTGRSRRLRSLCARRVRGSSRRGAPRASWYRGRGVHGPVGVRRVPGASLACLSSVLLQPWGKALGRERPMPVLGVGESAEATCFRRRGSVLFPPLLVGSAVTQVPAVAGHGRMATKPRRVQGGRGGRCPHPAVAGPGGTGGRRAGSARGRAVGAAAAATAPVSLGCGT